MDTFEAILKRRSIRRYTGKGITEEQIKRLLESAMAAPSANNKQPWEFIVVQDKDRKDQLSKVHPYTWMCADAPLVIVVCSDKGNIQWIEDCSAATENMLLAATDMGLGTCWIAARGTRYSGEDDEQKIRDILGIPKTIGVLCMVSFGYPAEEKPPRTQYKAEKVYRERYGYSKT
ncbi:MAG: nitroreductase family protein [Nitrospinota bacterium]